ncbi:acetyl-CoA acetyltransferase [Paenibacillus sp. GCM10012306]|uniref:acetyl-CoA acetyltransferase n=1 Tax=Paenibacillus sp. GCM10012306 TaxID=3317342 RepID=UPI00362088BE
MSIYNTGQQPGVIYQADPAVIRQLQGVRDSLHQSTKPHINRQVRVQTADGLVHEGTIAGVDSKHLYLNVAVNADASRGFFSPYATPYPYPGYSSSAILPLVLYELLVISLL